MNKRLFITVLLVVVAVACMAQRPRKAEPVTVSNNRVASTHMMKSIEEKSLGIESAHTGAQRHFEYSIESIDVDEEEAINVNITITVNPSNNKVTVRATPNDGGMRYELYDETTACLAQNQLRGQSTNIAFSRYREGEYTLRIIDAENHYSIFRIVKSIN